MPPQVYELYGLRVWSQVELAAPPAPSALPPYDVTVRWGGRTVQAEGPPVGRVLALVGDSGMGKSTLAALLCAQGARFLTDDLLRVQPDGPGVRCFPGTGEIRLRPGAAVLAAAFPATGPGTTPDGRTALRLAMDRSMPPPGAIVLPRPSRRCQRLQLEQLSPSQALLALMASPRVQGLQQPEYLQHRLDTCTRLAAGVLVFQAEIPWGPPFPQDLAATLVRKVGLAGLPEGSR